MEDAIVSEYGLNRDIAYHLLVRLQVHEALFVLEGGYIPSPAFVDLNVLVANNFLSVHLPQLPHLQQSPLLSNRSHMFFEAQKSHSYKSGSIFELSIRGMFHSSITIYFDSIRIAMALCEKTF